MYFSISIFRAKRRSVAIRAWTHLGIASLWLIAGMSTPWTGSVLASEWHPTVVVHGQFGDNPDEYGFKYKRIENQTGDPSSMLDSEQINVVSCFTVSADGIFLFDSKKSDIKTYTLSGDYVRTTKTMREEGRLRKEGPLMLSLPASDMAVVDDDVYLLCDFGPGWPVGSDVEWSRFQMFVFDRTNGDLRDRQFIHVGNLGGIEVQSRGQARTVPIIGSVTLDRFGKTVSVFDHERQKSYTLVTAGKLLSQAQDTSSSGRTFGALTIKQDREANAVNLVNKSGQLVRVAGTLTTLSQDGAFYVARTLIMNPLELTPPSRRIGIYDLNGFEIGSFVAPRRDWSEFKRASIYQVYELTTESSKPVLYELFVSPSGVQIIRWSE